MTNIPGLPGLHKESSSSEIIDHLLKGHNAYFPIGSEIPPEGWYRSVHRSFHENPSYHQQVLTHTHTKEELENGTEGYEERIEQLRRQHPEYDE